MSNRFFKYQGTLYPDYIKRGHAAKHIIPIAKHFCIGRGLDIGGLPLAHFPGAQIINPELDNNFHAFTLPDKKYDYIFSSHTLEHIPRFIDALRYWQTHLNQNGVLFLYLPHHDMLYWRPKNCKKHLHSFTPWLMTMTLQGLGFKNIITSERDLFWSFTVVGINRKENERST
jgi:hypothetical protein